MYPTINLDSTVVREMGLTRGAMVRKNRNHYCLGILGALLITCGLFPSLSTASDSNNPLGVEFYFKGRLISIVGEKTAPRTYVFNKGGFPKISIVTLDWAPYKIGRASCRERV